MISVWSGRYGTRKGWSGSRFFKIPSLVAHPDSSLVKEQPLTVGALLNQPFILRDQGREPEK